MSVYVLRYFRPHRFVLRYFRPRLFDLRYFCSRPFVLFEHLMNRRARSSFAFPDYSCIILELK